MLGEQWVNVRAWGGVMSCMYINIYGRRGLLCWLTVDGGCSFVSFVVRSGGPIDRGVSKRECVLASDPISFRKRKKTTRMHAMLFLTTLIDCKVQGE